MKYLYKITFLLLAAFGSSSLFAQDIQFSYVAVPNGDNTTTVTFSATNTGGLAENLAGFTIDFYYDDNETSVSTVDFSGVSGAPLNWQSTNQTVVNHQAVNNPLVLITHTGYFVYQNFDNNFIGVNLNPAETIVLGTVIFDNSDNKPNDGGEGWLETTAEQPGLEYFGDDFTGHEVFTNGTQQQILPIVIRSFEVSKLDRTVMLDWTTSSEVNGSHFEIERSQDFSSWTNIGTVKAVGESSTEQKYNFLDEALPLNTREDHKNFYYRLKMVDNDGSHEFSEIRSVRFDFDAEANFLIYPNPSINEVYVNLSSVSPETGPATLHIINMNGQLVKKVMLNTSDDIRVDISTLNAGVYNFLALQGEQSYIQKVIKVD
jgi:hypothetical protein